MRTNRVWWAGVALLSIVLVGAQLAIWKRATQHELPSHQLLGSADVADALSDYASKMQLDSADDIVGIPTGLFIHSLEFSDSSQVHVTGYIWQHFPSELPREYDAWKSSCEEKDLPFFFADQINSGAENSPDLRHASASAHGQLCNWFFEITIRQNFDYRRYPFDNKTVSLRLWTRDLLPNVVLVPDLEAYPGGTGADQVFGIDKRIVLNSWTRENTFFSYTRTSFDTTFGSLSTQLLNESLELNYNFVIKRKLVDAMVEHLLGMFVVMILLFATMLVVSRDPQKAERHGFNTAMVLGACSALFFVVLIAHIQIRAQFSGNSLVYMETYYYLIYLLLIGTTINTYYFSEEATTATSILHYRDNLIAKLCYWPVILIYSVVVSLIMLF